MGNIVGPIILPLHEYLPHIFGATPSFDSSDQTKMFFDGFLSLRHRLHQHKSIGNPFFFYSQETKPTIESVGKRALLRRREFLQFFCGLHAGGVDFRNFDPFGRALLRKLFEGEEYFIKMMNLFHRAETKDFSEGELMKIVEELDRMDESYRDILHRFILECKWIEIPTLEALAEKRKISKRQHLRLV